MPLKRNPILGWESEKIGRLYNQIDKNQLDTNEFKPEDKLNALQLRDSIGGLQSQTTHQGGAAPKFESPAPFKMGYASKPGQTGVGRDTFSEQNQASQSFGGLSGIGSQSSFAGLANAANQGTQGSLSQQAGTNYEADKQAVNDAVAGNQQQNQQQDQQQDQQQQQQGQQQLGQQNAQQMQQNLALNPLDRLNQILGMPAGQRPRIPGKQDWPQPLDPVGGGDQGGGQGGGNQGGGQGGGQGDGGGQADPSNPNYPGGLDDFDPSQYSGSWMDYHQAPRDIYGNVWGDHVDWLNSDTTLRSIYDEFGEGTYFDWVKEVYPDLASAGISSAALREYFGGRAGNKVREFEFGAAAHSDNYVSGQDPNDNRLLYAEIPEELFNNLQAKFAEFNIRDHAVQLADQFRSADARAIFDQMRPFFANPDQAIAALTGLNPVKAGVTILKGEADRLMVKVNDFLSNYTPEKADDLFHDFSMAFKTAIPLVTPIVQKAMLYKESAPEIIRPYADHLSFGPPPPGQPQAYYEVTDETGNVTKVWLKNSAADPANADPSYNYGPDPRDDDANWEVTEWKSDVVHMPAPLIPINVMAPQVKGELLNQFCEWFANIYGQGDTSGMGMGGGDVFGGGDETFGGGEDYDEGFAQGSNQNSFGATQGSQGQNPIDQLNQIVGGDQGAVDPLVGAIGAQQPAAQQSNAVNPNVQALNQMGNTQQQPPETVSGVAQQQADPISGALTGAQPHQPAVSSGVNPNVQALQAMMDNPVVNALAGNQQQQAQPAAQVNPQVNANVQALQGMNAQPQQQNALGSQDWRASLGANTDALSQVLSGQLTPEQQYQNAMGKELERLPGYPLKFLHTPSGKTVTASEAMMMYGMSEEEAKLKESLTNRAAEATARGERFQPTAGDPINPAEAEERRRAALGEFDDPNEVAALEQSIRDSLQQSSDSSQQWSMYNYGDLDKQAYESGSISLDDFMSWVDDQKYNNNVEDPDNRQLSLMLTGLSDEDLGNLDIEKLLRNTRTPRGRLAAVEIETRRRLEQPGFWNDIESASYAGETQLQGLDPNKQYLYTDPLSGGQMMTSGDSVLKMATMGLNKHMGHDILRILKNEDGSYVFDPTVTPLERKEQQVADEFNYRETANTQGNQNDIDWKPWTGENTVTGEEVSDIKQILPENYDKANEGTGLNGNKSYFDILGANAFVDTEGRPLLFFKKDYGRPMPQLITDPDTGQRYWKTPKENRVDISLQPVDTVTMTLASLTNPGMKQDWLSEVVHPSALTQEEINQALSNASWYRGTLT